mgnify:CR=1 FL=1
MVCLDGMGYIQLQVDVIYNYIKVMVVLLDMLLQKEINIEEKLKKVEKIFIEMIGLEMQGQIIMVL